VSRLLSGFCLGAVACVLIFWTAPKASAQQITIGYAIVTPLSVPVTPLVGFATFGLDQGFELTQAAVFPADVSNSFILYLSNDPGTEFLFLWRIWHLALPIGV